MARPKPSTDAAADAATADELAALDDMAKDGTWSIGGHEVSLTNLDKVLFPEAGLTKRDLIRYDVSMAPTILPYLRGRGLTLTRYPNGTSGPHFWEKEVPKHAPAWLARWHYESQNPEDSHTYAVADRAAALAFLANQAAIELHPWTSRTSASQRPTYALIDIDPGPKTTWPEVLVLARLYRTALGHLGVRGYPKVTGKRGVQVWIPIEPRYSFSETSAWVEGAQPGGRGDRTRAHLVGVVGPRQARPRSPRLHAEREQQDTRRAVLGATGGHGPGLRADRLGRAR